MLTSAKVLRCTNNIRVRTPLKVVSGMSGSIKANISKVHDQLKILMQNSDKPTITKCQVLGDYGIIMICRYPITMQKFMSEHYNIVIENRMELGPGLMTIELHDEELATKFIEACKEYQDNL